MEKHKVKYLLVEGFSIFLKIGSTKTTPANACFQRLFISKKFLQKWHFNKNNGFSGNLQFHIDLIGLQLLVPKCRNKMSNTMWWFALFSCNVLSFWRLFGKSDTADKILFGILFLSLLFFVYYIIIASSDVPQFHRNFWMQIACQQRAFSHCNSWIVIVLHPF